MREVVVCGRGSQAGFAGSAQELGFRVEGFQGRIQGYHGSNSLMFQKVMMRQKGSRFENVVIIQQVVVF